MARPPPWDLYRSFLAVMDAGSLSGAARDLAIAQPTVGRHIEALERSLGCGALFTRSPGGLRPTSVARALAPQARAMASAAETLARTASGEGGEVRGAVRLTASDIVGVEVLPPILTAFREAWPKVDIELALSNRLEDLLRRDADIAVRMARPTQNALFARRVGVVNLTFHAHRDYLARHGEPRSIGELRGHTLIGFDRVRPIARAISQIDFEVSRELFALRTDSEVAQLAHLRAGFGICPCQPAIARRDPDLVPILTGIFGFDLEVWVVMHEDLKADRRMRLLFDHLAQGLKAGLDAGG
ncbi:MAG: LysR family transcriptional regulator [Caulobacteraceae bacterium]|nr:LysR family transcriptional regulator [Caulobacteraceae bacterium]